MESSAVVIAGPTGSGKSALALCLADAFSGELVNCDSLQLYRGFDIGTAKTPLAYRRGIPHHLFDVLNPPSGFSAGDYARAARQTIADIASRGRLPIVVGGTGFYLHALLRGLPPLPEGDETLRKRLSYREQRRAGTLHRLLRRLEPGAATRIHPRDVQKLVRALEIRILTRAALPAASDAAPFQGFRWLQIGLEPSRDLLIGALATRTRRMFESGLVAEVEQLLKSGLSGDEKPFESLGYKQVVEFLRGKISLEAAITLTEIETRQYAKRQLTWFRRDPAIIWFAGFGSDPAVAGACQEAVRKFLFP